MPFAHELILRVPVFYLGLIILIISVAFSILGLFFTRRILPHRVRKVHNDVAGPIFATLGVIYAVLLAFVVVVTWQNFDRANMNAENEAGFLNDLYTDSEAFSENKRNEIRALIDDYRLSVLKEEWEAVSRGEAGRQTEQKLKKIWRFYTGFSSQSETEKVFFKESVRKLNEMCELRRIRLLDSRTGIHGILWFVLVSGGVITIIFSFFFGTENFGAQLIMTTLLSILIAMVLFTILELDYPFTGEVSIKPVGFSRSLDF